MTMTTTHTYSKEQIIEALWNCDHHLSHEEYTSEQWDNLEKMEKEFKDELKDKSISELIAEVEEWVDPDDEEEDYCFYSVENFMEYFT